MKQIWACQSVATVAFIKKKKKKTNVKLVPKVFGFLLKYEINKKLKIIAWKGTRGR